MSDDAFSRDLRELIEEEAPRAFSSIDLEGCVLARRRLPVVHALRRRFVMTRTPAPPASLKPEQRSREKVR